jgi:predicted Holliday junction resolvase-like endonuclease
MPATLAIQSNAGVELDSVISTIALILFVGILAYYLLPKSQRRRRRTTTPKHKQYDDSHFTDQMMERIMKVYDIKEEANDTDEEAEDNKDVYRSSRHESVNKNAQKKSG